MSISFKVEAVPITAIRDRAMFNTFAGNKSYVIKDIGDELEVTYSASSFVVTLGSGEAVICGGSMLSEGEAVTTTLGDNETGYIVIEIDLAQVGENICTFKKVSSLVQGNINDTDMVYDFPLYSYVTNGSGVSSMTDMRLIVSSSDYDKQNTLTAGNGIKISGATISNQFADLREVDLNDIKDNFNGRVIQATANYPGTQNSGNLIVSNDVTYRSDILQIWSPAVSVNDYPELYFRKFDANTWKAWRKVTNNIEAGRGIQFDDLGSSIQIFNQFTTLGNIDLDSVLYNFQGYVYGSSNYPSGTNAAGVLISAFRYSTNDRGIQIYMPYNSDQMYFRRYAGSWNGWRRLSDTYAKGDTLTLSNYTTCAAYTLSDKKISFLLPLSKPITASNVQFTALPISAQFSKNAGSSSYVINNVDVASATGWTISQKDVKSNGIFIQLTPPSSVANSLTVRDIGVVMVGAAAISFTN